MKEKPRIVLIRKFNGKKEIIAEAPYTKPEVYFNVKADKLDLQFSFGEALDHMNIIGGIQSLLVISESSVNKFNGTGIGVYTTSNGQISKTKASFDWFEYKY